MGVIIVVVVLLLYLVLLVDALFYCDTAVYPQHVFFQYIMNFVRTVRLRYAPQLLSVPIIALVFICDFLSAEQPFVFRDYIVYFQLILIIIVVPLAIKYSGRRTRMNELKKLLYLNRNTHSKEKAIENWNIILELNQIKRKRDRIFVSQLDLGKVEIDGHNLFDIDGVEFNRKFFGSSPNTYQYVRQVIETDGFNADKDVVTEGDKYILQGFDFQRLDICKLELQFVQFKDCSFTSVRFCNSHIRDVDLDDLSQNILFDKPTKMNSPGTVQKWAGMETLVYDMETDECDC